jgi:hypothetical protein
MSIRVLSLCALVLSCLGGSRPSAWTSLEPQAQAAKTGDTQEAVVVAIGCLVRQTSTTDAPTTGHEGESAHGLTLTKATLVDAGGAGGSAHVSSAVPGSRPTGVGSETVAKQPAPSRASTTADERAFWIAGSRGAELTRYIGQRVQVTGTLQQTASEPANSTGSVGTGGTRTGDTRTTTAQPGTRAASGDSRVAHPSAPTQTINVTSFSVDGGKCP